jgi:hypothetical protein
MTGPESSDPPLTFDWARPRGRRVVLALWMVVTLFALVAFFALFRVVYPQAQRSVPSAQQVVILHGADPANQVALNAVRDRDFMILPGVDDRSSRTTLESAGPVFHPSFENRQLQLLDLPQGASAIPPVRLHDLAAPVLPPLDLGDMKPLAPETRGDPPPLSMSVSGELAARKIELRPDFAGAMPPEPEAWRFQIAVDGQGRVVVALPLDAPGKPEEVSGLLRLLRTLRFSSAPRDRGGSLETGIVSFRTSGPAS